MDVRDENGRLLGWLMLPLTDEWTCTDARQETIISWARAAERQAVSNKIAIAGITNLAVVSDMANGWTAAIAGSDRQYDAVSHLPGFKALHDDAPAPQGPRRRPPGGIRETRW